MPILKTNHGTSSSKVASVRCVAVSPTTVTLTDEGMPAIRSLVGAGANGRFRNPFRASRACRRVASFPGQLDIRCRQ